MAEKRKSARSRTFFGGVIAFNQRKSTMNCHVRNFSQSGAKVVFTNPTSVPDEFDLKIKHKELSFRARMVWRGANEAGVAFLSEDQQDNTPVPLEWAKRLRDCEAERAALRRRIAQLTESNCA